MLRRNLVLAILFAASAAAQDAPPSIQLTSSPAAGSGNGMFRFQATANGGPDLQWVYVTFNTFNLPQCSLYYYLGSSTLWVWSDLSQQWVPGSLNAFPSNSNSYCNVGTGSSWDGTTGTLSLDLTFLAGLQQSVEILMEAYGVTGLDSGTIDWGPWNTVAAQSPSISSFSPGSGPLGTVVTISGSGFGSSQGTVSFNGVAAGISTWADTQIVASAPVNASTGPITVTAGGLSATSGGSFVVTGEDPPTTPQLNTLGVFRATPSTGGTAYWYFDSNNSQGYNFGAYDANPPSPLTQKADVPVVIPWTPGGRLVMGVFRSGYWYLDANNDRSWEDTDATNNFGMDGDIPVVGDWMHDGSMHIGVVRPATAFTWYVQTWCSNGKNVCDFDPNPVCQNANPGASSCTSTTSSFSWGEPAGGQPADIPVIGNWDGQLVRVVEPDGAAMTGILRIGVIRPSPSGGSVPCPGGAGISTPCYIVNLQTNQGDAVKYNDFNAGCSGCTQTPLQSPSQYTSFQSNFPSNISPQCPVESLATCTFAWNQGFGVFNNGTWYVHSHYQDPAYTTYTFGQAGDVPVPGPWSPFVSGNQVTLTITTTSLPNGDQGASYSQYLNASGGTWSYTSWSIIQGSLPPGLSLSAGGALSGTPSSAGTYSFTIRVTDSSNAMATQQYTVTINSNGPSLSVPNITWTIGSGQSNPFSETVTAQNFTGTLAPALIDSSFYVTSGGFYVPNTWVSVNFANSPPVVIGSSGTGTLSGMIMAPNGSPTGQYIFYCHLSNTNGSPSASFTATVTVGNFQQYYLTTSVVTTPSGTTGGTISPSSGWYSTGTQVSIIATAYSGYHFTGFSGGTLNGTPSSPTVTMNGPTTVVANFAPSSQPTQTITSAPSGLHVTVDGSDCVTSCVYSWAQGTNHTISAVTQFSQAGTTQYLYQSWSDGLAASHQITAGANSTTYTANFATDYQLTTKAVPSNEGTISPTPGNYWYLSGAQVAISATANSGYTFSFSGDLTGFTSPATLTMNGPKTVEADFGPIGGHCQGCPPSSDDLSPLNGTGQSQTFTAVWSDPGSPFSAAGPGDQTFVDLVFTPDPTLSYLASVVNGCHIEYWPYSNELYLESAAGDGTYPYSSARGPGGQPLSNGVCIVDAAGSVATPSGDSETLSVPVTFTQAATYYAWTSATSGGVSNNWAYFGQWTPALISESLTVNGGTLGGTGSVATFTAVFADTAGVNDINDVNIALSTQNTGVINSPSLDTSSGSCHLFYAPASTIINGVPVQTGTLSLESATGGTYVGSSSIGSGGQVMSNGSCQVDASQFTAMQSGSNGLTVSAQIAFTPANDTQYWAYTSITSKIGPKNSGWTRFGFWQAPRTVLGCGMMVALTGTSFNNAPGTFVGATAHPSGGPDSLTFQVTGSQANDNTKSYLSAVAGTPVLGPATWIARIPTTGLPLGLYAVAPVITKGAASMTCPAQFFSVTTSAPNPPGAINCASLTGTWADTPDFSWAITDTGGNIGGHLTSTDDCGNTLTWTVNGTYSSATQSYDLKGTGGNHTNCGNGTPYDQEIKGTIQGQSCGIGKGTYYATLNGTVILSGSDTITVAERIPVGESTSFAGWGDQYGTTGAGIFHMVLTTGQGPSYNFAGRSVQETIPITGELPPGYQGDPAVYQGKDSCFWSNAPYRTPYTQLQTLSPPWNVQNDSQYGAYGPDYVYPDAVIVANIQRYAPAMTSTGTCTIQFPQKMVINKETGFGTEPYGGPQAGFNMIIFTITPTGYSVSRGAASGQKNVPF